jgi:hypothetical protein
MKCPGCGTEMWEGCDGTVLTFYCAKCQISLDVQMEAAP